MHAHRRPAIALLALAALTLLASATPAHAWGRTGHQVVGQIAGQHLTPAARARVRQILGRESLAVASLWADAIKDQEHPDHRRDANRWHYVNIQDGGDLKTLKNEAGHVLWAIDRYSAVLRDPAASRAQQREALRFLAHFVGDLHMPLHVGRAEDRGGNHTFILWKGEDSNLHYFWDVTLVAIDADDPDRYIAKLDSPTPEQIAAWQRGTPWDWGNEGVALRPRVYDFGPQPEGADRVVISQEYVDRAAPMARRQLQVAGIRLAGLLNQLLDPQAD